MRELNQLLIDFDIKRTFNDHDYYVCDSNYFAFNLTFTYSNGNKYMGEWKHGKPIER